MKTALERYLELGRLIAVLEKERKALRNSFLESVNCAPDAVDDCESRVRSIERAGYCIALQIRISERCDMAALRCAFPEAYQATVRLATSEVLSVKPVKPGA